MTRYIIGRLLATIPVLGVVALFTFALLHFTPGDPAAIIAGDHGTAEDIAAIRIKLGLERPLYVQLGIWLSNLAQGDLGTSLFSDHSVTSLIIDRMEPTIALMVMTQIMSILIAVPLGILAAWKANTWIDRVVMIFMVLGLAVPVFWLGFMLIWLFGLKLSLLPVAEYRSFTEGIGVFFSHILLPSISLSVVYIALVGRMTRASMLEVLKEDYIRTAQAKGLAQKSVLLRHALKNASLPIVTIIGIGLAALISGAVVTESVFAIPGLGRLVVDSILHRDYPIIQGLILLVTAVYVFVNLGIDLIYGYLDPRIRY